MNHTDTISSDIIKKIVNTIADGISPQKIFLFGSYALGNPNSDSDLDLLVIMDTKLPHYKRATPIKLLFDPYPCPMDILVFTKEEFDNLKNIRNHIVHEVYSKGRLLYEK